MSRLVKHLPRNYVPFVGVSIDVTEIARLKLQSLPHFEGVLDKGQRGQAHFENAPVPIRSPLSAFSGHCFSNSPAAVPE